MQTMRIISAYAGGPSRLAVAASLLWIPLAMGISARAQTPEQGPGQGTNILAPVLAPVIPQQVRYAGTLASRSGDTVEAVFSIYAAPEGGEALWTETQHVTVDRDGSYSVLLGSATTAGLPQSLFAGGAARWLGVSVERAPELERVLLSSVPYAMKSADAQALAGHPAGDFVTQQQLSQFAQSEAQRAQTAEFQPLSSGTITGSGTTGKIPEFTGTNTIGNSEITQVGSDIGINEPTPAATLDVNGPGQFRGTLTLPPLATATTSAGQRSQWLEWDSSVWSSTAAAAITPIYRMYAASVGNNTATAAGTLVFTYQVGTGAPSNILTLNSNGSFVTFGGVTSKTSSLATSTAAVNSPFIGLGASVYKSSTSSALAQGFDWQVIPTGNNTSTPSSNLALLYSSGTATPATTGFSISPKGLINWAPGQTFPGAGAGTITGITTTSPLTGSGTSGSVALGLNTSALETNLNAVYPRLGAANNFTGTQTITSGDLVLPATTSANSGIITIGGVPFLHGYSSGSQNVFVGGAGNLTATGSYASAMGTQALASLSSGKYNTAAGGLALFNDTTGAQNTAFGLQALYANTTGTNNTAIGFNSGNSESAYSGLSNSTAVGANSAVSQSNSLVLGQTSAVNPGEYFVNVGIGTPTPRSIFEVAASATSALGPVITLTNPAGGATAEAAVDFNTSTPSTTGFYNPGARILAVDDGSFSDDLFFFSNKPGADNNGLALNMVVASNGQVGIGTSVPCCSGQLVVQSANSNYYGAIEALGETAANEYGVGGVYAIGGDSSGSGVAGQGGIFNGGNNAENGTAGDGINAIVGQGGANAGLAGYFSGDVLVGGQLEAESKNFKIDHPSDPANKYLVHSSVESSERMNIYTGNVFTDNLGIATVTLPDWFEVLNTDFRYQLTVIGRKAQAWISQEVKDGRFIISSDATNTKISWQITAVRQDPYAKAHPLVVEQEKNVRERGFYIEPALYGQPEEKQTEWGRHPEIMRRRKADLEAAKNKLENSRTTTFASEQPASAVNRPIAQRTPPSARPTGSCALGNGIACPKSTK